MSYSDQIDFIGAELNWTRVFSIWKLHIDRFSAPVSPLFTTINLKVPTNYGFTDPLVWWPRIKVEELRTKSQQLIDNNISLHQLTTVDQVNAGSIATIGYLWGCKDDLQAVSALLITASLFGRIRSSRKRHPSETWPPISETDQLLNITETQLKHAIPEQFEGWLHSCSSALPVTTNDYDYKITNIESLIRYLAEEHAALFHRLAPVALESA